MIRFLLEAAALAFGVASIAALVVIAAAFMGGV